MRKTSVPFILLLLCIWLNTLAQTGSSKWVGFSSADHQEKIEEEDLASRLGLSEEQQLKRTSKKRVSEKIQDFMNGLQNPLWDV